jgi:hypothetical protein
MVLWSGVWYISAHTPLNSFLRRQSMCSSFASVEVLNMSLLVICQQRMEANAVALR